MKKHEIPLPPFIENAENKTSEEFRFVCLAWNLTKNFSREGLAGFVEKQKPKTQERLQPLLIMCRAWALLNLFDRVRIRAEINATKIDERDALRTALNELKHQVKEKVST